MTEPRDNQVPQAVDRVMTQLKQDNTEGALKQIHDEMNKPGGATESNKEFLTALTQKCQEQGYLPKLAVDFGQKNFKALDLNGNGNISSNELQHVLNDKKMMSQLDPFQREMAAYLLANSKEIGDLNMNYRGAQSGITASKLDTYAKQADTKYETYQNGQNVLKQFGTPEKFNAVDSDKDGFISPAEIDKQLDFADRALATPGLVTPEAAKNLKEQKEALEYMKSHRGEIAAAANDTYFSNDASLKDIQAYAAQNGNPREKQHIPQIDDKIADASSQQKGRVDMSRGEHMSEVMLKYHLDHQKELDLDGNGKVSRAELDKILTTPKWNDSLSADERKVIEEMRNRFDQISTGSGRGSTREITFASMAEYLRKEETGRDEEAKSDAAAKYARENFAALDSDKNGWLSQEEMDKTKDFYAKALATGLIPQESKAKVEQSLAALKYLEEHKRDISSAYTNNDMTLADVEKFAKSKAGKINDIFKPTEVEATKEPEKKQPVIDRQAETPKATDDSVARARKGEAADTTVKEPVPVTKPDKSGKPNDKSAVAEKPVVPDEPVLKLPPLFDTPAGAKLTKPEPNPEMDCKDGVCKVPTSKYPHLEAGTPKDEASPLKRPEPNFEIPEIKISEPELPKLEGPVTEPKLERPKPLIDQSELRQESPEEVRARTSADLPAEPVEAKVEKTEAEKPAEKPFKYTQENYADALNTAVEQNKPVVLVVAASKDQEAIRAAADANKDGKSVVVFVDKDTVDAKSPLGAYAASVLENHNKQNGTNDESMITVFHVNKDTNGKLVPEAAKFANYGNPGDIVPLLSTQVDEAISRRAAEQARAAEIRANETRPVETRPVESTPVTELNRPGAILQTCSPAKACNNTVTNYQHYYYQNRRGLFRRGR
jgi:Ca2+-binding EF-hand superfamily protein